MINKLGVKNVLWRAKMHAVSWKVMSVKNNIPWKHTMSPNNVVGLHLGSLWCSWYVIQRWEVRGGRQHCCWWCWAGEVSRKKNWKKKTYHEPKQHHRTSFGLVLMFLMHHSKVGGQEREVVSLLMVLSWQIWVKKRLEKKKKTYCDPKQRHWTLFGLVF